ncbi:MAG: hypothetical protein AABZ12_11050 [Planctomycetota bacterium]
MIRKCTFAVVLAMTASAPAQQYEISRYTIDGGGVMRSTGGAFELSGTIGQPDAGAMTGGGFELTGGFWFALAPTDCNEDGGVNLFDFDTFESCLSGPSASIGGTPCPCYDVDGDSHVTLADFASMQIEFIGQ